MYLFPKNKKLRKNLPILNWKSIRKEKHFTCPIFRWNPSLPEKKKWL